MGLVQNLKKRLTSWVDKILVELSYHYIIQKAKQTTKKQDNSSQIKSLLNSLTTEHQSTIIATSSQDILEKITMEQSPEAALFDARKWSIDRLNKAVTVGEKDAIYKEFEEWIEVDPDDEDLEVLYLENLSEYYKEGG